MTLAQLALKFILYNKRVTSVIPNVASISELEEFAKVENLEQLTETEYDYLYSYSIRNYRDLNDESIEETKQYK